MGRILSDDQCQKIKELRSELKPYAELGWMSEGSDAIDGAVGICFNNGTDEYFYYDLNGKVLLCAVKETSYDDVKKIASIEAAIDLIAYS
jgi:hypothetical protein